MLLEVSSVVFRSAGSDVDAFKVTSVFPAAGSGVDELEVTTGFKVLAWEVVGITQSISNWL